VCEISCYIVKYDRRKRERERGRGVLSLHNESLI